MLYVIYGNDHSKARKKLSNLKEVLKKKRPQAEFFKIDNPKDINESVLEELSVSQGLFDKKYIVQIDGVMSDKNATEVIVQYIPDLASSENVFIFIEPDIEKKVLSKIQKHADKVEVFLETGKKETSFNAFSLADALGQRNRKDLWVKYHKALLAGKEVEEIHGIIFWQLKSIILASGAKSAKEAGLKQFPFQKSKRFSQNYTSDEVHRLLRDLVDVYHSARRGGGEMSIKLERFILSV